MNKLEYYHPIFTEFLSKWESELQGCNYSVELGFKVVSIEGSEYDPLEILLKMCPKENMSHATFKEIQRNTVVNSIIEKILDKDPEYGFPRHYTSSFGVQKQQKKQSI